MTASSALTTASARPFSCYYCIECLEPCSTLYRQYTKSRSSIKLTTCIKCSKTVDPYIEREWLLVILDCILLRVGSYRHVLFNRVRFFDNERTKDDKNDDFMVVVSSRKAVQYVVASTMLGSYIQWEALLYDTNQSIMTPMSLSNTKMFMEMFAVVLLQLVLLWCGTCATAMLLLKNKPRSSEDNASWMKLLSWRLYLAILFPTAIRVVVVLVLIWENTPTIRLLGFLFLRTYQTMAVTRVMEQTRQGAKASTLLLVGLVPLLVGMVLQTCLVSVVRWLLPLSSALEQRYPCVGLEIPIWFMDKPLCLT